jgi:arsenate reductase
MNLIDDFPPALGPKDSHARNLLFVCNHNAGRSQIAQAFFERYGPQDVRAESAGTEPAHQIWASVVEVMGEVGFDLSERKPKKLTLEMQLHADWAITMGCGDACPYVPTAVESWDLPDPGGRPIDDVRVIRDEIQQQVRMLIAVRLEAIRTDRTAHELRLSRLLPGLVAEFGDTKPAEVIRGCTEAALATFEDARVRSHIITLAHRKTRECLRQDTCELLPELVT